jgi:hypothetical protein
VSTWSCSALAALQGRLLLLWLVVLWLPTAILSWPLLQTLSEYLDHSLLSGSLANGFDLSVAGDLVLAVAADRGAVAALRGAALISLLFTLLLSPLLTGMAVAAIRSEQPLGFLALLQGGLAEYGKLLRMLLLNGVLLIGTAVAGVALVLAIDDGRERAVVAAQVGSGARWATLAVLVVAAVVHASVEAGRAQLAADRGLGSALRAWLRGCRLMARRPLATLSVYLLFSLIGYAAVIALGLWRVRLSGTPGPSFALAFLVTQLLSLASAWMRIARLYGLTELVRSDRMS